MQNAIISQTDIGTRILALSSSLTCPRCGASVTHGASICWKCGKFLAVKAADQATVPALVGPAQQTPSTPSQYIPPPRDLYPGLGEREDVKKVERTKTGLLLLAIGTILGPIPFISFLGGILDIIGAILVIISRNAFGPEHSRNTIISLVLYIIGIIIVGVSVASFTFSLITIGTTSVSILDRVNLVTNAFNGLLIGALFSGIITGIGTVLFTYALQKLNGRLLLLAGYIASIIVGAIEFIVVSPLVGTAVAEATAGEIYNPAPILNLQDQIRFLGLLGLIPASLFATAYYLARSRIKRGELPVREVSNSSLNPKPA